MTDLSGSGGWNYSNVYAGGKLLATYRDTNTCFNLNDWLGTKRVVALASGKVCATYQSLPFGNYLTSSGTGICSNADPSDQHFTGKQRDTESGLDYFGARYLSSTLGRWMSPDSSAKAEPVPYAKLDDPQSLNLYAYVGNNPLSRMDPDGHYQCGGTKDQCAQFQTGLNLAKAAMNNFGAGSKEGKAIGAVLKFYGSATDKNGVAVSFGTLKAGTLGVTTAGENGGVNIKFDLKQISDAGSHSDKGGVFSLSERSGTEVHEGTHGTNIHKWGGGPTTREQVESTEHHAYTTESYVYRGLGVNSDVDLSSPQAIDAAAERSVREDCAGNACKP